MGSVNFKLLTRMMFHFFQLNVCIYELYTGSKHSLPGARILPNSLPGIAFSPDGRLLVVAEKRQNQLAVYSCVSWNSLQVHLLWSVLVLHAASTHTCRSRCYCQSALKSLLVFPWE
jgi:hypothetical protein